MLVENWRGLERNLLRIWTSQDYRGPRSFQTATNHRKNHPAAACRSLAPRSLLSIRRAPTLPHALDHLRLTRSDVEEHQGWTIWSSTIRLLDLLGEFPCDHAG
jgi:hypothetical protein